MNATLSNTNGHSDDSVESNQVPTPMLPLPEMQALAMHMLSIPTLSSVTLKILSELPEETWPLLWKRGSADPASAEAWTESAVVLNLLDVAALPDAASAILGELVCLLGYGWRAMPQQLLSLMMTEATPPLGRLKALEIQHVALWAIECMDPGLKVTKNTNWEKVLRSAMAWRLNDEIELRKQPFDWNHPHPNLTFGTFDLQPIASTAQLVDDCRSHYGALCNSVVAHRSRDGLEAWWLASPKFRPGQYDQQVSAVGLERNSTTSDWTQFHFHAEPAWAGHAQALVKALMARANGERRTALVTEMTGKLSLATLEIGPSFRAMLSALKTHAGADAADMDIGGLRAEQFAVSESVESVRGMTVQDVIADVSFKLILDTNVLAGMRWLLDAIDSVVMGDPATHSERIVVPGCVFDEMDKIGLREPRLHRSLGYSRQCLERWLDHGILSLPGLAARGQRQFADPIVCELAMDAAKTGEVAVLTDDRSLRIRLKASGMPIVVPVLSGPVGT